MNAHRLVVLALLLVFAFSIISVQTSVHAAAPVTVRVNIPRLNIRADAGVRAARVAVLKAGTTLTVLGQKKVNRVVWYEVQVQAPGNQVGWVVSTFVKSVSGSLSNVPVLP